MPDLPTGTITLLFTDMEGTTRLLQQVGERYASMLADCRHLLSAAFAQYHGHEVDTQGDAFFVAFARASDAVLAAVEAQRRLAAHPWPRGANVRVRMGLHTGEPQRSSEGYIGLDVHHAARIMSAGHGGQILLSQTTCDLVAQALPDGVGLQDLGEHQLKDLHWPSRLFQLVIAGLPADFPQLRTLDAHRHNLPIQPTPFIGREREVATVCGLLRRADVGLVTLTGTGGMGKTRLGLQVAAELADQFADGVVLVPLAPLTDPVQVLPTIIQVLSISERSGQAPLSLLTSVLKDKQMLLLLDNCEPVIEVAVPLAELLAACPKLKLLVTSQVLLHVQAEHAFAVPPLSLPNPKRLPDLVTLSQYEAVALFIQRTQTVKPDFALTNANAPTVAAICARLDGLPLAIELAAARSKFFAPQALLSHLEQGLAVLTGGARDLPVRQQTLRGAMAWSYNLLEPEEQMLFRRVAVFVDGCSWKAAEGVCRAAGELETDLLEGLLSLADKSLLRQQESAEGEPRFWMLQMLREFGLERLASAAEIEPTRQAHAQYFLEMAEQAEAQLKGAEQARWVAQLEQEHENLRAALRFLLEHARLQAGTAQGERSAELSLRMGVSLSWFWLMWGQTYDSLGEFERARADYEQALHLARSSGDRDLEWQCLLDLGVLWTGRDYQQAGVWLRQALELAQALASPSRHGHTLNRLGNWLINVGQIEEGLRMHHEALALFEELHETQGIAATLNLLGVDYGFSGDVVNTVGYYERSIALLRAGDDPRALSSSLSTFAYWSSPCFTETTFDILGTKETCLRSTMEALQLAIQADWPSGQAFAELVSGHIRALFGEFGAALAHAHEGLHLAAGITHHVWMAASYYALTHIYVLLLAPHLALQQAEAGLALGRESVSTWWFNCLATYAALAHLQRQELAQAEALLVAIMPRSVPPRSLAERRAAWVWGELALMQGKPLLALEHAEHLLASAPGANEVRSQPIPALLKLKGEALTMLNRLEEAEIALQAAHTGAVTRGMRPLLWRIAIDLGNLYRAWRRDEEAEYAFATAQELVEELAATIPDTVLCAHFLHQVTALLPHQEPLSPRRAAKRAFGGLTEREREVAALIAQGKASREIAEILVVNSRTIEKHIENILSKLGFTSRAQIAVWASEKGLVGKEQGQR